MASLAIQEWDLVAYRSPVSPRRSGRPKQFKPAVVHARLLLLYRSSDLIGDVWPPELEQRNKQLRDRIERAVADVSGRLGATSRAARRRVRFAMIDIPYGAVRTPLAQGAAPEPELDPIVHDAVLAVIDGITQGEQHEHHRT